MNRETVRDCGCKTRVKPGQKDITGQRFGLLVALNPVGVTKGNRSVIWHLKCDCGKEVDVPLCRLTAGKCTSCGCQRASNRKDLTGERFGKLTVLGYKTNKNNNRSCYLKCKCDCGNVVEVSKEYLTKGRTKSCGCLNKELLKERLRLVDGTSVTILKSLYSHLRGNNTSGYTGVYLNKKSNKWVAEITFKGNRYYLGSYSDKIKAIEARKLGEEKHRIFLERVSNE